MAKHYISGVLCPEFKIGDVVRLRTPEEIDETSYPWNDEYSSYREWIKDIREKDKPWDPGKQYIIEAVIPASDDDEDEFPLVTAILYTPNPNEDWSKKYSKQYTAASWCLIKVEEETSKYRTTFDGF